MLALLQDRRGYFKHNLIHWLNFVSSTYGADVSQINPVYHHSTGDIEIEAPEETLNYIRLVQQERNWQIVLPGEQIWHHYCPTLYYNPKPYELGKQRLFGSVVKNVATF